MASIIIATHADFLVVVGDRNQRNGTIHSKRQSKLVEMDPSAMRLLIWKSWPQNPLKTWARIEALTASQLDVILGRYVELDDLGDRLAVLAKASARLANKHARGEPTAADWLKFERTAVALHEESVAAYARVAGLHRGPLRTEGTAAALQPLSYRPNDEHIPHNTITPWLQRRPELRRFPRIPSRSPLTSKLPSPITTGLG